MVTASKTCFKCGLEKPLPDFYRHAEMADGHLNKCKECTKSDVRAYRRGEGRRKVLAYDRLRSKRPERRARANAIAAQWRENHPDRRAAQVELGNAVRDGKIVPLPCEVCGAERAEAHHASYDLPLTVTWLCSTDHKRLHAEFRAYLRANS